MPGHKTKVNRRAVVYWITEPPKGTNEYILLIHGFGGTYSGLEDVAEILSEKYGILGVDLPGYGLSEPMHRTHSVKNYANFLYEFCQSIGVKKVHVVGHSFGADIAIVLAAKHPALVQKLVLLNPVISSSKLLGGLSRMYYGFVGVLPRSLRHQLLHNHFLTWVTDSVLFTQASEAQRQQILRDDYISDHLMGDTPVLEGYRSILQTPFLKYARRIQTDTLLIGGAKDVLASVSTMAELHTMIALSKLEIIHDAGHFYPLEKPQKVSKKILSFLAN